MAYIEPSTALKFLDNVPLDPSFENTLYFSTPQDQYAYFSSRSFLSLDNNSYQRKNRGVIRCGWEADRYGQSVIAELYNCHYMMFRNENFENKWFYAFVDKVEYVNNNTVDVFYSIDVMQTWHFDYVFNQCLIERQHVSNDSIGANTIPEGLESGPYMNEPVEYLWNGSELNNSGQYEYTPAVCIAATVDYIDLGIAHIIGGHFVQGRKIDGLKENASTYTAAYYYYWELTTANLDEINDFLYQVNRAGMIESIISVFMVPLEFASILDDDAPIPVQNMTFFFPSAIDGYEPRNNKVYNYPYTFFYVSNNQGGSAEYMLEYFKDGLVKLRLFGNLSPNAGMICWPVDYKGCEGNNFDEALTVNGFPMCTWGYDSFKAWLAQNAGTISASALMLAGSWYTFGNSYQAALATNFAQGAFNNAIDNGGIGHNGVIYMGEPEKYSLTNPPRPSTSLVGATLGAIGQLIDHARKPPQAVGNANIDLNYQSGLMTFNFYYKHIKAEYARIIDSYFDMYGYAVHTVGTPNRNARRCYTYVKTVGCSLNGSVPSEDLRVIEKIFDSGIRFWRSTATFGSYDPTVNDNTI